MDLGLLSATIEDIAKILALALTYFLLRCIWQVVYWYMEQRKQKPKAVCLKKKAFFMPGPKESPRLIVANIILEINYHH